ncbi:uncharacterized protein LOC124256753 [Haliotis rubra]|uniref:uncharacterized protein LOC124256753 n=1 Tax=Haliotis rubra TaxID=36100 RepID=UPI001EE5EEA2|nr:uncharacterized protein LOC124256753 [Haliotis rubra]
MAPTKLHIIWTELCHGIRVGAEEADKWWTTIVNKYTEIQRHYHTLDHIADMFVCYNNWKQRLGNCSAVALAIFFHDIVYDPKSSSNEQDSIQMFRDFAHEAELDAYLRDATIQLIDATITHVAVGNRDLKFFLDFDMAVLGRPADGYSDYARQIQREYCHLDTATFNSKRAQVLQNFLARDHIFSTEEFTQLYEEKARSNMAREISVLQSQSA